MASLTKLKAFREELFAARMSGLRELQDQNGERIQYKSDSQMAAALAALDAEIAAASRSRSNTYKFQTSKGL